MYIEGQEYSRKKDIHEVYGGQTQGGISTPASHQKIFIFTGKSGEQHGYADGWQDSGVFLYTGEGQVGDMSFKGGNLAIRDHDINGKPLLLFEALGKSKPVRFIGQFSCQTWDIFQGVDRNGDMRECIRFHLVRCKHDAVPPLDKEVMTIKGTSIEDLRKQAFDAAVPQQSMNWNDAPRVYRSRSKAVRDYVLARAGGICELTGRPAPFLTASGQPYLEVHHTRRLADEGPDDPRFVAAICPAVHREIHFGENGDELNRQLVRQLEVIEPNGN
ncbi:HNH endonuclease [Pseudovibrio sp. WM33]|uniref:HNH endonuclease n=1 Tax=Pseudovibrio sp. WM33 TaxID=1735585 RepID=UPI0007AE902C|nr:HNH endonuclease signature motif containing protein [Pseudovibrio sp. WM33]KZL18136.1 hypothetical protein PsWM33_05123 [Pseudovibrio sp. WM33]